MFPEIGFRPRAVPPEARRPPMTSALGAVPARTALSGRNQEA
jgi:hypothetical protein